MFGGWLIAKGQMETADLAMYALYIGIFISPIQILVELTEMMQKGLSGFRRFLAVVETEPDIVDAEDAKPLENVKGTVEYKDVSFHYSDDDTLVLSDVSFRIDAGKIYSVGRTVRKRKDNDLFIASKILRCDRRKHSDRRQGYSQSVVRKPSQQYWSCAAGCVSVLWVDKG